MKFRKKFIRYAIISVASLSVILVVLLGTMELTSKPTFCSTCHYMEPYVEGWKLSSHSEVTCTDCHFPPGFKSKLEGKFTAISMVANYMTGIYKKSKPWAEISDASCLRPGCHTERVLSGKVLFNDNIIFDHEPHLTNLRRGKKLRCTSCHSQIVQGKHISVTESTCFLCHFKNQDEGAQMDDCTWCHDAPIPENGSEVAYDHTMIITNQMDCRKCHGEMQVGDGTVPIERCNSCHADIHTIRKYNDVDFIHKNHVTDHKVECQNCHLMIQHKSISKSREIIQDCSSCHDNTHKTQLALFTGTGGRNVADHPNPMFDSGLNCQACHIFHDVSDDSSIFGDVSVATYESCDICHGSGYNKLLVNWKVLMDKKIQFLDSLYNEVMIETNLKDEGDVKDYAKSLIYDAKYNFELVKMGNIVHNVAYSDELLQSAYNNLSNSLKTIKSEMNLPEYKLYGQNVPSDCANCHYGQEEIDSEIFGLKFSHNIHIEKNKMLCSECHTSVNQHGELSMTRNNCLSCHHSEENNCETCHETQVQFYSGTIGILDDEDPDIMYDEDIDCRACHDYGDQVIGKSSAIFCVDCHDSDYEEVLNDWQESVQQQHDKLLSDIKLIDADMLDSENRSRLLSIKQGLDKISADKSSGAHNYELISRILEEFQQDIEQMVY